MSAKKTPSASLLPKIRVFLLFSSKKRVASLPEHGWLAMGGPNESYLKKKCPSVEALGKYSMMPFSASIEILVIFSHTHMRHHQPLVCTICHARFILTITQVLLPLLYILCAYCFSHVMFNGLFLLYMRGKESAIHF